MVKKQLGKRWVSGYSIKANLLFVNYVCERDASEKPRFF